MQITKPLPQLTGTIKIVGKCSRDMTAYIESLGLGGILGGDSVVIAVDEEFSSDLSGEKLVCPFGRKFDRGKFNFQQILTYAVEDNGADLIAKNIRERDDFTSFELLAPNGIGRVYVDSSNQRLPYFALALAGGLIFCGISVDTAILAVSRK